MRPLLLFCMGALALASCSTYKQGFTPDDVYYTEVKERKQERRDEDSTRGDEYVQTDTRDDARYRRDETAAEEAREETEYERYLRLRVRNRDRWEDLDEYYRNPWNYRYTYGRGTCNCACDPNMAWNQYYNPYRTPVVIYNPKVVGTPATRPAYRPRTFDMTVYSPGNTSTGTRTTSTGNVDRKTGRPVNNGSTTTDTRPSAGSRLRDVFRSSVNGSSSPKTSGSQPSSPSSSSSSSSTPSRSSGGSAPVRRF